jgi:metal iron transporter
MNCPSRTEEPEGTGFNQSPRILAPELTTRQDLNGIANARVLRRIATGDIETVVDHVPDDQTKRKEEGSTIAKAARDESASFDVVDQNGGDNDGRRGTHGGLQISKQWFERLRKIIMTFGRFIGPGFMISVAYIDPGNYSTDVAAGASYRFKLLFIVLMSNIFAIFLQSLCIRLGSVSGLNLAEACKEFLPKWLNISLYLMAEAAVSDALLFRFDFFLISHRSLQPTLPK